MVKSILGWSIVKLFDRDAGYISHSSVMILCSAAALFIAAIQAYGNRDHIFQIDAISYLDISDAILQGRWNEVANSHWSPLYPAFLTIFRILFHPDSYGEPAVVKATNFFIYLLVLCAFNFFLATFLREIKSRYDDAHIKLSPLVIILCLYCWFWWASLGLSGVYVDTPDLLVTASMLAASAIILCLKASPANRAYYIWLGTILGLGYLAKSIIFPIAFIYIGMAAVLTGGLRQRLGNICLAFACFCLFAVPQITAISLHVGHFTFSDSGRLDNAVFVARSTNGTRPHGSRFIHPPRVICDNPNTLEFATPVGGTYPLWYEPIYWNEGISIDLSKRIIPMITVNAALYLVWFCIPILLAVLAQYVVSLRFVSPREGLVNTWYLWLPAVVGLSLYMLAVPMHLYGEGRYLTPHLVLLAASVLAALNIQANQKGKLALAVTLVIFCSFPFVDTIVAISTDIRLAIRAPSYRDWRIAQGLRRLGIKANDQVALLGYEQQQSRYRCTPLWTIPLRVSLVQMDWYYWARLAHLRIVAHVVNDAASPTLASEQEFLKTSDAARTNLYSTLAAHRIKAIIYNPANRFDRLVAGARQSTEDLRFPLPAHNSLPIGWQEIEDLECYVYLIPSSQH
jgi:hypothetical protein